LKLEITEQVALEHDIKIKQTLSAIHDGGIRLEMDDFGMGHSSLLYLKEYHFHTIKLDGSLVREICSNASCREIIASIVYLSKSLNYNVLAEFVETEEQRRILHTLGCNQYQGQLFSKAISFEKLVDYIIGAEQGQKVGVSEQAGSTH
jgi:EAL domain-containing protein (putative c-di-GMP-specific phosphodiesterase class I)